MTAPTSSLVSAARLADLLAAGRPPALLDVRWELAGGPQHDAYRTGHLPGAVFVDLDAELAGPPGAGGRHPLPEPARFQAAMRRAGVGDRAPVVVYDAGPALAAARAWWLLRYFGHPEVSVLDGGLAAWVAGGGGLATGDAPEPPPGDFVARPGAMPVLDADGAAALAEHGVLLDARAPERFRGEQEPIDPVAGHIPGAVNHPTTVNLDADGRLRPPGQLRAAFEAAGVSPGVGVGAYCGSGITAAHLVLALHAAGYAGALYPGSWSEWIADARRPVARGQ